MLKKDEKFPDAKSPETVRSDGDRELGMYTNRLVFLKLSVE